MAQLSDYINLITSEHRDKPNFLAVLGAVLQPMVDNINTAEALPGKMDLDAAVGAQLDIVGQWVGLSRKLTFPITGVFFSFDTGGLGFDEGIWFSPATDNGEVTSMDDTTYRMMIMAKIAADIWDGSLGHANELLAGVFPMAGVQLKDNFDMSQTFILSGTAPSVLFSQLVAQGYIELRPAAVNLI